MTVPDADSALQAAAAGWGLSLGPEQFAQIDRYVKELLAANRKTNLTSDTDPEVVLLRHVADGLAAAGVLIKEVKRPSPRILDLGAGGGYIGMAIKIAWPQAQVTLMESLERKFRFLNGMAVRSGLPGLTVALKRAGKGQSRGPERGFDAVVARALAPLPEAVDLALPLIDPQGLVLIFQSAAPDPEEQGLARVLARHAARWVKSVTYRLPREGRDRCLALFSKACKTGQTG
ncbi:MAG: 16S rRNA (guanine(527)-N(7))-methyltransferase RsmG [Elusimicrobia bacterium]|nr:16S rRNA (guanine(527)-N(7))-methyltransferase RsmG [Elusimicrobiota bacterium]